MRLAHEGSQPSNAQAGLFDEAGESSMAITNHERVGKALELLRDGLRPFVERELSAKHGKYWITAVTASWHERADLAGRRRPSRRWTRPSCCA